MADGATITPPPDPKALLDMAVGLYAQAPRDPVTGIVTDWQGDARRRLVVRMLEAELPPSVSALLKAWSDGQDMQTRPMVDPDDVRERADEMQRLAGLLVEELEYHADYLDECVAGVEP